MQKFFMTGRVEKLWQFVQTRKVKAEVMLTAVGKAEDYDLPCMLFSSVNPATWDDEFIFPGLIHVSIGQMILPVIWGLHYKALSSIMMWRVW